MLTLGVSGLLRQSNLIMWDRETQSWWQQGDSRAIVGALAGKRLEVLPATVVTWRDFAQTFAQGLVLSRDTGHADYLRAGRYGVNPYTGYDTADTPFLFEDKVDRRLQPMTRVVGIGGGTEAVAYPYPELEKARVVHDEVAAGIGPVVIFYEPSALSTLDRGSIARSRAVGTANAFVPKAGGKRLNFKLSEGKVVDRETGSVWNVTGTATEGRLIGQRLLPTFHVQAFWFYWAAINPDTRIYQAPG